MKFDTSYTTYCLKKYYQGDIPHNYISVPIVDDLVDLWFGSWFMIEIER